jgi:hypothetical protein
MRKDGPGSTIANASFYAEIWPYNSTNPPATITLSLYPDLDGNPDRRNGKLIASCQAMIPAGFDFQNPKCSFNPKPFLLAGAYWLVGENLSVDQIYIEGCNATGGGCTSGGGAAKYWDSPSGAWKTNANTTTYIFYINGCTF